MSRPVCANCLCLIDETGCGCVELNAGGEPVKNATYWKRQYDKLADRIAELEKQLETQGKLLRAYAEDKEND